MKSFLFISLLLTQSLAFARPLDCGNMPTPVRNGIGPKIQKLCVASVDSMGPERVNRGREFAEQQLAEMLDWKANEGTCVGREDFGSLGMHLPKDQEVVYNICVLIQK